MAVLNPLLVVALLALYVSAGTISPDPNASQRVLSQPLQYNGYGIHEPHGLAAVQYLYGPEGTWRTFTGLENVYGYYNVPDSEFNQLHAYANGSKAATTPDPDNNVLFHLAHDSGTADGAAFMEHNGRGAGGAALGTPFSNFWYDDNWLARYMTDAYGATPPGGLYPSPGRWQIIGLGTTNWPKPDGTAPDQRALMGLYNMATGDLGSAMDEWNGVLSAAGSNYDSANQRYTYPNLDQNYYLGLFKILTDRLMDAGVDGPTQATLFQHSISLRSMILADQQAESGRFVGWCTDRNDNTSLINTETTAAAVLGLGAGAKYSYEADISPMVQGHGNYFVRSYGVLSAVAGKSTPGMMVYGPYVSLPSGKYTVDFYLRSGSPGNKMTMTLDANDAAANKVLGTKIVNAKQLPGGNKWGRFSVDFTVSDPKNQMEFRLSWSGQANLDVSAIRVR